jgi:hypothetical protein
MLLTQQRTPPMILALLLAAATPAPLPQGPALTAAIEAVDAEFFGLFFTGCDPKKLATEITPNFEFYHDKDGVVATNGPAFVELYAKGCEAKKAPDAWRSRRELVPGTVKVWQIGSWGAVEQGEHVFYERKGDGPEKKVGRALFTQLWMYENGQWKLARVLSYDHSALP